jgi:MFS transporter, AAHS family, 4-hydroxybenzoate transporter
VPGAADRIQPSFPDSARLRVLFIVGAAIVLEGFDIQVIGFTAPAMLKEWHLTKQALGPTMAAALMGMMAGASGGGWLGDHIGRRPVLIWCIALFSVATLATAFAGTLLEVTALRLLAGLGFGAALSASAAMIAEWVPRERAIRTVGLVIVGVPAGGLIGSVLCSWLIPVAGWRAAFLAAGALPMLLAVVMWIFLPESPDYLKQKAQDRDAGAVQSDRVTDVSSVRELWSRQFRRRTIGLSLAFLANLAVSYALFGWFTLFMTTLEFPVTIALRGAVCLSLFGTLGSVAGLRFMTDESGRKVLFAYVALGIAAVVAVIALLGSHADLHLSSIEFVVLMAGMSFIAIGCSGTQTGLYGLAATAYPTRCRASGIGVAAAFGRAGGLLSSLVGGSVLSLSSGPATFLLLIGGCFVTSGLGILIVGPRSYRELSRLT